MRPGWAARDSAARACRRRTTTSSSWAAASWVRQSPTTHTSRAATDALYHTSRLPQCVCRLPHPSPTTLYHARCVGRPPHTPSSSPPRKPARPHTHLHTPSHHLTPLHHLLTPLALAYQVRQSPTTQHCRLPHQPGRDRRTAPHQSPTTMNLSPTTPVAYHTVPRQVRRSPTTRHWPTRRCACAWSSMAKVLERRD